ncbi:STAS domain-containing protein [Saccharopolyspora sp. NPDC049426]|uniref:STAS domain-containing protein n=1 Tax=Saccharopolyspora sp. NPDC049426 TaxID=3155652 RepID=UPI00343FEF3A
MSLGQRVAGALGDEALHDTTGKAPAASVQVTFPRPDAVVATVSAPVDRDTVDQLETMLWPQPTSTARLVVVDLTDVSVLDVPDLQLLTHAHMLAHARGGALHVVVASEAVQDALHAAGLRALLECHATVADALAATTTNPDAVGAPRG